MLPDNKNKVNDEYPDHKNPYFLAFHELLKIVAEFICRVCAIVKKALKVLKESERGKKHPFSTKERDKMDI